MKIFLVTGLGIVGLLLVAAIYVAYRLKRYARTVDVSDLAESAKKIPTIPMMDPDSFETSDIASAYGGEIGRGKSHAGSS